MDKVNEQHLEADVSDGFDSGEESSEYAYVVRLAVWVQPVGIYDVSLSYIVLL